MKLQHLAIGARFEYEGQVYVKTGPLTASAEQGGQRVIPRYAVLKPLDLPTPETPAGGRAILTRQAVLKAFNAYHATCQSLIGESAAAELEEARQRFIAALK